MFFRKALIAFRDMICGLLEQGTFLLTRMPGAKISGQYCHLQLQYIAIISELVYCQANNEYII